LKVSDEKLPPDDAQAIRELRLRTAEVAHKAQDGHVPSAISILEPTYILFKEFDVTLGGANRFVLSKGHGILSLWVVMERFSLLGGAELDKFGTFSSPFGGHPDRLKAPQAVASTGSLGHGLPIAVGIAYSKLHFGPRGHVFSIVGDGECNEGSIWEAALLASHHKLANLTVWIDYNRSGDRALLLDSLSEKWKSFGFDVMEINSHDLASVRAALSFRSDSPVAIIAHSTKGKGITFMEDQPAWHHGIISDEDMAQIRGELG
jgi:transketolase